MSWFSNLFRCWETTKELNYCEKSLTTCRNQYNKLLDKYEETDYELNTLKSQFGRKVSELTYAQKQIKELKDKVKDSGSNLYFIPETVGIIALTEVNSILKKHVKNVYLSDTKYKLIKKESMVDFLKWDKTDAYKYITTYYDCDDFSYRLMGQASIPAWADLAFGIAWSKSHAFNIFIDSKMQVYVIEPQTDRLIKIEDTTGAYSDIQLVVM